MKRIVIFTVVAILLSRVVSASASNSNNANGNNPQSITPTVTPTEAQTEVLVQGQGSFQTELRRLLDQVKNLIGSFVFLPNY